MKPATPPPKATLGKTADALAALERDYVDACSQIMAADEAPGTARTAFARIRHHRDVLHGG